MIDTRPESIRTHSNFSADCQSLSDEYRAWIQQIGNYVLPPRKYLPRSMVSRSMRRLAEVAVSITIIGLFFTVALADPATSSAQPTPFCDICGASFSENVTSSTAKLQMTTSGDVHWHVENELRDPTATEWRENPNRARSHVEDQLDQGVVENLTVGMEGDTLTITFVDEGAARHRLGVLVLPYLHGDGIEARYVINAERLTIVAPDGHRVLNNPPLATVEGDRVVWQGVVGDTAATERTNAPEPGDAYVITGSGPTAEARSSIAVLFEPLDPIQYILYGVALLFFTGLAFSIYTVHGHRLGPRRVLTGLAVVVVPYLLLIAAIHPPKGGLGGAATMISVAILSLMFSLTSGVWLYSLAGSTAAAAEDRP